MNLQNVSNAVEKHFLIGNYQPYKKNVMQQQHQSTLLTPT